MTKKKIHTMLIKFQNQSGKLGGRAAWQAWKVENNIK